MRGSHLFTVGIVALVALATASLALAGDPVETQVAKSKDGPYGSTSRTNAPPGSKRTIYLRSTNNIGSAQDVVLRQDAVATVSHPNIKVRWYDGNDDITAEVKSDAGYEFPLADDESERFRLKVKAKGNGQACIVPRSGAPGFGSTSALAGINSFCTS